MTNTRPARLSSTQAFSIPSSAFSDGQMAINGLRYPDADVSRVLSSDGARCLSARAFRLLACLLLGIDPPPGTSTAAVRQEVQFSGLLPEHHSLPPAEPAQTDAECRTRQGRRVPSAWRQRFEQFWDQFGYKSGRLGAITAWYRLEQSARDGAIDFDSIYAAAGRERQRAAMTPQRPRMMAEGWLNDRRWEDEVQLDYTQDGKSLIQAFNLFCPRALKVTEFNPARGELIRASLERRTAAAWSNYFKFLGEHAELLSFAQPSVSLQLALSMELDCKVRELRNRMIESAGCQTTGSPG